MATQSDWEVRKARLDSQITQLNELVNMYQNNTRATSDILQRVEELENKLGQAKNRKHDAENSASTFDREFIERKETFPSPFVPSKIYTIQDFTLFFFFVCYVIFFLALSLSFPTMTLKIILLGGAFITVILGVIYRYA